MKTIIFILLVTLVSCGRDKMESKESKESLLVLYSKAGYYSNFSPELDIRNSHCETALDVNACLDIEIKAVLASKKVYDTCFIDSDIQGPELEALLKNNCAYLE